MRLENGFFLEDNMNVEEEKIQTLSMKNNKWFVHERNSLLK